MTALAWLIPAALLLGGLGLVAFLWALRSGQFEDLEGASYRALEDEPPEAKEPLPAIPMPKILAAAPRTNGSHRFMKKVPGPERRNRVPKASTQH
jgi:cbb3-type cytochrome oxidase maturation protein